MHRSKAWIVIDPSACAHAVFMRLMGYTLSTMCRWQRTPRSMQERCLSKLREPHWITRHNELDPGLIDEGLQASLA